MSERPLAEFGKDGTDEFLAALYESYKADLEWNEGPSATTIQAAAGELKSMDDYARTAHKLCEAIELDEYEASDAY